MHLINLLERDIVIDVKHGSRQMRLAIGRKSLCALALFASVVLAASGQQFGEPGLQPGKVSGTVTDMNDGIIRGADVLLQSSVGGERRSMMSSDDGSYNFADLRPGVAYRVTISAPGFVTWTSPEIIVGSGQVEFVTGSKLHISGDQASVTVYASSEQVAAEQVKLEERQRVFGIIPNF